MSKCQRNGLTSLSSRVSTSCIVILGGIVILIVDTFEFVVLLLGDNFIVGTIAAAGCAVSHDCLFFIIIIILPSA